MLDEVGILFFFLNKILSDLNIHDYEKNYRNILFFDLRQKYKNLNIFTSEIFYNQY